MLRAMYAGISGLQTNQEKLDIIGNNIANVNTTAFKSQTVKFEDTLSQNMSEATSPGINNGGTNPVQIGLGSKVAGINTLTTQGDMQPTNNNYDFAVDGSGFFVVGKGSADGTVALASSQIDAQNTTMSDVEYTRDGGFTVDSNGSLLTADGYRVMGYALQNDTNAGPSVDYANYATDGKATVNYVNAEDSTLTRTSDNLVPLAIPKSITDANGNSVMVKSFSVDNNGVIKAVLSDNTIAALGQIAMATFNNDAGLSKAGGNLYSKSSNSGDAIFRTSVGEPAETANDSAFGNVRQGYLEMSNVDLSQQFTDMIVASRAFQANGKIITTSDQILQDLINLKQ